MVTNLTPAVQIDIIATSEIKNLIDEGKEMGVSSGVCTVYSVPSRDHGTPSK